MATAGYWSRAVEPDRWDRPQPRLAAGLEGLDDDHAPAAARTRHAERFLPTTATWISAGDTIVPLAAKPANGESGAQILRPDDTVFVAGATGHTAIYHPPVNLTDTGVWKAGPDFPVVSGEGKLGSDESPAALLPDGHVLLEAHLPPGHPPSHFFEFDGRQLIEQPTPCSGYCAGYMLVLPTGQVLLDAFFVYTAEGKPDPAWRPVIERIPRTIARGRSYRIFGRLFNGLSQAVGWGDDYQGATNYPLVRITNEATGHVFYARTFDHSSMAVGDVGTVHTHFQVSAQTETGASILQVVANGIASKPAHVTVE